MLGRKKPEAKIRAKLKALGVLGLLLAASFLIFSVVLTDLASKKIENSVKASAPETLNAEPARSFLRINSDPSQARPLLPLSVIPRGVASAQELKTVLAHDPVASAHYAGFSVANSQIVKVEKTRAVYVSYRLGNQIFWTKNRMLLRRGETLISDGRNSARTRCGNRISDVAMLPTSAHEPPMKMLEDPAEFPDPQFDENPLDFTPLLFTGNSDPLPPDNSFIPPPGSGGSGVPIGCCGSSPPTDPPVKPPVTTPEPETWFLLMFALAFLCLIKKIG